MKYVQKQVYELDTDDPFYGLYVEMEDLENEKNINKNNKKIKPYIFDIRLLFYNLKYYLIIVMKLKPTSPLYLEPNNLEINRLQALRFLEA